MRPIFLLLGSVLGLAIATTARDLLAQKPTALLVGAAAGLVLALFVMCAIDFALEEVRRR